MRTILKASVENDKLQLLIEVKEISRAFASYFVNGIEITDWEKLKPIYKDVFSSLFHHYCKDNNLFEWSY